MTEPGAPTSAPPALAATTATSRDRLGRRPGCRRPGRLKTPERASAPPHNRAAPRGASRHARARGRRAPRCPAPVPPLGNKQARPGARSRSRERRGGSRARAARSLRLLPRRGNGEAGWDSGRPKRAERSRARGRARAGGADRSWATAPTRAGSWWSQL